MKNRKLELEAKIYLNRKSEGSVEKFLRCYDIATSFGSSVLIVLLNAKLFWSCVAIPDPSTHTLRITQLEKTAKKLSSRSDKFRHLTGT